MKIVYEDFEKETADYPYIPGFLAFKEIPVYTILFNRLKTNKPELYPQVLLVDGNGILHTRGFGCASHIGVFMDIPSIGVGKNVFAVDGITQLGVKELCEKELLKGGDQIALIGNSGKEWGVAYRSTNESKNPIIISVGHRVSSKTSVDVVKACIRKFRIPEPVSFVFNLIICCR
jgi:deoxyinosine 3'endonuclease (endonuclease V)